MPLSAQIQANWSSPPVFRVFEHELLQVGQEIEGQLFSKEHFESLVFWARQTNDRYFSIGHQSIRFKHFVGILSTPYLAVEILPKADRSQIRKTAKWQQVLIDMLRTCLFVQAEDVGSANLRSRPGDLLEWYVQCFFSELEKLLRVGLLQHYQPLKENLGVLKGNLQFAEQIKYNAVHKERFFVRYNQFNNRHPANLLLGKALKRLDYLPLNAELKTQLRYFQRQFPQSTSKENGRVLIRKIGGKDRKLDRYEQALNIAQHILQDELPDIRSGSQAGLALLFDMNLLFEEYLYRQLLKWKGEEVQVERQQSRVFFGQNRLRPDLVLISPKGRWVLDTKWRVLKRKQASADELRQIYVYCDYFQANSGVLIFPRLEAGFKSEVQYFAPLPAGKDQNRICHLYFANILNKDGSLNKELGKEILNELMIQ